MTVSTSDRALALGLAIMIVSESATLAGIEPFASWNTPIAWTGFIVFADSWVYRARGDSWMRSAPREFAGLALISIPLWILFEGYNLVIRNWYYTGLPENFWLRQFGFAWSFATIWPAIFEAAELFAVWRGKGRAAPPAGPRTAAAPGSHARLPRVGPARGGRPGGGEPDSPAPLRALSIGVGAAMLAAPFLVSPAAAVYMAAPVWLGFIFLIEPINRRLGLQPLTRERLINLSAAGLLCGGLWEFWNYWSLAKWHYTVPIMAHLKLFEMPLPGYFGFPAFAVECFTLYVFVRGVLANPGRTIAL